MTAQFERARLERRLATEGPALARHVIGALLGRQLSPGAPLHTRLGEADIMVMNGGQSWRVTGRGRGSAEGSGALGLIACAFDISPGTAAQLIIEAVNGSRMPAEIGHAIRFAIDHGGVWEGGVMTR